MLRPVLLGAVCRISATCAALVFVAFATATAVAGALPNPLTYLRDVDRSIAQDIRYATADNFTGSIVAGYDAPECILTVEVARALSQVQADIRSDGISLKVYDCYRPERAVQFFLNWVSRGSPTEQRSYYPIVNRKNLVTAGYIASNSNHSRGIAVDLSLIDLKRQGRGSARPNKFGSPCNAIDRPVDDSVDMGTNFDCFDAMSATASTAINPVQRNWREKLRFAMERRGFRNYPGEWWHYTFASPTSDRSFNVPIRPRPTNPRDR